MSAAERAYADTLSKQLNVRDIETAQLRHDLAELRAAEVDLRRENAAQSGELERLRLMLADVCLCDGADQDLCSIHAVDVVCGLRSQVDSLQRDLAQLKALDEFDSGDWIQEVIDEMNVLRLRDISSNDALVRLDRENAALQEDRARLEWLKKNTLQPLKRPTHVDYYESVGSWYSDNEYRSFYDAIDAARGKAGE